MNSYSSYQAGDLRSLLDVLRRRGAVIILAVAVGVAAALWYSTSQPKRYESTASLLFQPLLLDVQVSGVPLQNPGRDPQREAETNLALVSVNDVRARAAAKLGPGYTAKRIEKDVEISSDGNSNIVLVQASGPTAAKAARVANAVATSFVEFRRSDLRDQVVSAADKVRQTLRRGNLSPTLRRALRTNLQRLTLLASVQTGDVKVIQGAEPASSPSSPKPLRDGIIGGVLGLVLGLGLAFFLEALDPRVRRTDQLEDALSLPLLAAVPRNKLLRRSAELGGPAAEAAEEPFRQLRANLRHLNGDAQMRSVLVTSASQGSGKTTVATHLAAAAAAGGLRVLLIEADLRRPRLAAFLELPLLRGLSTLLRENGPLGERIADHSFRVSLGAAQDGGDPYEKAEGGFDALPAGPVPDNPSELLDSRELRELLTSARVRYDLVVIEAPPPTLVSDAIPLLKQVDGVLIVGRMGRESDGDLRQLHDELKRFNVTPVGAVANFSRRPNRYYTKSG